MGVNKKLYAFKKKKKKGKKNKTYHLVSFKFLMLI